MLNKIALRKSLIIEFLFYPILAVVALCYLWKASLILQTPAGTLLYSSSDSMGELGILKSLVRGEWGAFGIQKSSLLGAPFTQEADHLPVSLRLYYAIFSVLTYLSNDPAKIFKWFLVAAFPLTAMSSFYALRRLVKLDRIPSCALALIYAFLPFHFSRLLIYGHHFLAAYFLVPLMSLVFFSLNRNDQTQPIRPLWNAKTTLLSLVIASTGIIYSFFFCMFSVLSGTLGSYKMRSWRPLLRSLSIAAIVVFGLVLNFAPNKIAMLKSQQNMNPVSRTTVDLELYGLKLTNILIPHFPHRIKLLETISKKYSPGTPDVEGRNESIGIIASAGLLILLAIVLFLKQGSPELLLLGQLNLFAILYSSIGGLGIVFALLVSPQIRCLNRISIFIAWFSLLAVGFLLKKLRESAPQTLYLPFVFLIGLVGLYDNATPDLKVPFSNPGDYASDQAFIHQIESSLPDQAMVFQLPYVLFPEVPSVHRMLDYSHFRGFLHSDKIRWSYGLMKGTDEELFLTNLVKENSNNPTKFIQDLANLGFSGIYIDRAGYPDNDKTTEVAFQTILGNSPITSSNDRLVFFDIRNFSKKGLKKQIVARTSRGIYPSEKKDGIQWNWSDSQSTIRIRNFSDQPQEMPFNLTFATPGTAGGSLLIHFPNTQERIQLQPQATQISKIMKIPPGVSHLHFKYEGPRVPSNGDPRNLYFMIENLDSLCPGDVPRYL